MLGKVKFRFVWKAGFFAISQLDAYLQLLAAFPFSKAQHPNQSIKVYMDHQTPKLMICFMHRWFHKTVLAWPRAVIFYMSSIKWELLRIQSFKKALSFKRRPILIKLWLSLPYLWSVGWGQQWWPLWALGSHWNTQRCSQACLRWLLKGGSACRLPRDSQLWSFETVLDAH